jgi:hypothetical protein
MNQSSFLCHLVHLVSSFDCLAPANFPTTLVPLRLPLTPPLPPHHNLATTIAIYVSAFPKLEPAVAHLLSFCRFIRRQEKQAGLPCFLFGESMGGTICLLIDLLTQIEEWAGTMLVAPMCRSPTGSARPGRCLRSSPTEDRIEDKHVHGRRPSPDRGFDCVLTFFRM